MMTNYYKHHHRRVEAVSTRVSLMMPSFYVMLVSSLILVVEAYPNGASTTSCVSLIPGHGTNQSSSSPYELDVGDKKEYTYDEKLMVTIKGSRPFQGILLQARGSKTGTTAVGHFETPLAITGLRFLRCNFEINSAITHDSDIDKEETNVYWKPPKEDVGDVYFVATIAKDRNAWWTNIKSTELTYKAGPTTSKRSTVSTLSTTQFGSTTRTSSSLTPSISTRPPRPSGEAGQRYSLVTTLVALWICRLLQIDPGA